MRYEVADVPGGLGHSVVDTETGRRVTQVFFDKWAVTRDGGRGRIVRPASKQRCRKIARRWNQRGAVGR